MISTADPLMVPQYSAEIIEHLLARETQSDMDPSYLAAQPEITDRMRATLNDWLIDVVIKFKLHMETMFLTVNIVDRFLSRHSCLRSRLQLVGITSILLASKHDEIWPPPMRDCVSICANTYTEEEIIDCERDIASALRFRLTVPTSYQLASHILDTINAPTITREAAMFFLESSSLDSKMLHFLPSRVAGAAVLLALATLSINNVPGAARGYGRELWDDRRMPMSYDEIAPAAEQLLSTTMVMISPTSRLQALRRKYSQSKHCAVALMVMPSTMFPRPNSASAVNQPLLAPSS